jgi:hypothetical protein
MRHAGSEALDRLEPLLVELRALDGLVERKRGIFYKGSRAFLHFHEDPSGLHADVRLGDDGDDFERRRVETKPEQMSLVADIRQTAERLRP